MIKQEQYENKIRRYSDRGKMISDAETGAIYSEAIDYADVQREYYETEYDIVYPAEEATGSDYQAALSELGVNV